MAPTAERPTHHPLTPPKPNMMATRKALLRSCEFELRFN